MQSFNVRFSLYSECSYRYIPVRTLRVNAPDSASALRLASDEYERNHGSTRGLYAQIVA